MDIFSIAPVHGFAVVHHLLKSIVQLPEDGVSVNSDSVCECILRYDV